MDETAFLRPDIRRPANGKWLLAPAETLSLQAWGFVPQIAPGIGGHWRFPIPLLYVLLVEVVFART